MSGKRRMSRRMLSWTFGNPMSLRFAEDPDATDDAIAEAEAAEKARQAEIDKAKQQAEQEAANAKRAREQVAQLQADNQSTKAELESLKTQLQQQAAETSAVVPDLDESEYQDGDVPIVKAIKALQQKIDARDKRIAGLEKEQAEREKRERAAQAERAKEQSYNELLTELDGDYGAQHRNAAVKAFNALVADGKVPDNAAKATRILESCYKNAVKAAKKPASTDTTVDPGTGGGRTTHAPRTKLTKGSLEEVSAQLAAST